MSSSVVISQKFVLFIKLQKPEKVAVVDISAERKRYQFLPELPWVHNLKFGAGETKNLSD